MESLSLAWDLHPRREGVATRRDSLLVLYHVQVTDSEGIRFILKLAHLYFPKGPRFDPKTLNAMFVSAGETQQVPSLER